MIILVIGEFCYDDFVYGTVNRICPEAPVPIFVPTYTTRNSGMAGNVYNNLKALSKNHTIHFIRQTDTIIKTRYVEEKSNQMLIRVDGGEEFVQKCTKELNTANYDLVIVSDYNKGFLSNKQLLELSNSCTGISIIDSKRHLTDEIVKSFNFVKVNELEYQLNKEVLDNNIEKVIITLGKNGAMYMDEIIPSPSPKETIDVSGAGDTFTASFALKYCETKNIIESIKYANEMSSIVVSKRGVVTPL